MNSKQVQHASAPLDRIRALKAEGLSLRQIAAQLHQDGVPPPGRSSRWHHNAVDRLLARAGARPEEASASPPAAPAAPTPQPAPPAHLHVKIQGPWRAADTILWEFLLHQVWPALLEESEHTIPLVEALRGLRLTPARQDQEHLWDALDRLAASRVLWEARHESGRLAIVAPLLSAWASDTSLAFAVPPALLKLLHNPEQYAHLKALLGARN